MDTSASISLQQSPAPGTTAPSPLARRGDSALFNLEYFEVEWERLCNTGVQMVTLLIIRVEGVGAAAGSDHDAANLSLLRTAQVFEAALRKNDFLARLSHNEFGLLLPRADARVAGLVCARLAKTAEKLSEADEATLRFRFGVASGPPSQTTFPSLLREAASYVGRQ